MAKLHNTIKINAPVDKIWSVLTDLESIQHYSKTVKSARYISKNKTGVGSARECEILPKGRVKERVTGVEPEKSISFELYETDWPLVFMRWTTSLKKDGDGTIVSADTEYKLKYGIIGQLMDSLIMKRKFHKIIDEVFENMKKYIENKM